MQLTIPQTRAEGRAPRNPSTSRGRLAHGHENYGDLRNDEPAQHSRYTEARLSLAGEVVLAAERGEPAPVPARLINGSTYVGGIRPPFRPERIIEAPRQIIGRSQVSDAELIEIGGSAFCSRMLGGARLSPLLLASNLDRWDEPQVREVMVSILTSRRALSHRVLNGASHASRNGTAERGARGSARMRAMPGCAEVPNRRLR